MSAKDKQCFELDCMNFFRMAGTFFLRFDNLNFRTVRIISKDYVIGLFGEIFRQVRIFPNNMAYSLLNTMQNIRNTS